MRKLIEHTRYIHVHRMYACNLRNFLKQIVQYYIIMNTQNLNKETKSKFVPTVFSLHNMLYSTNKFEATSNTASYPWLNIKLLTYC